MYTELIRFAKQNGLTMIANRTTVKLKAYIKLNSNGDYEGISVLDVKNNDAVLVPSFGSARFLQDQANAIVDYKGVMFRESTGAKDYTKKSDSYLRELKSGAVQCPCLQPIVNFFDLYWSDVEFSEKVNQDFSDYSIKSGDYLSFLIDGQAIETKSDEWGPWLDARCKEMAPVSNDDLLVVSSVTGEKQKTKLSNLPSVSNIHSNVVKGAFGLGRSGYFAAADKQSYVSYGLDKALSFSMGEEDAGLLVAGVEYLLNHENHRNLSFNLVYFYDDVNMEDVLGSSLHLMADASEDDMDDFDDDIADNTDKTSVVNFVTQVLQAVENGQSVYVPESYKHVACYMSGFSALSGRCFFSHERRLTCYDLMEHLIQWYEDTKIVSGVTAKSLSSLFGTLCVCVRNLNDKVGEQVEKEFADLKYQLLDSVYFGKQIPELLYQRALQHASLTFVRKMDDASPSNVSLKYVQILKCYLNRKGYKIMSELSVATDNVAYHCGRLFAVYEQLQFSYNSGRRLNKNLAQSYFRGAMKQPGMIFPKVSELGVVYLNGLKSDGKRIYFQKLLGELSDVIGTEFPKTFNRDEQGAFVLGYYHQKNEVFKVIAEQKSVQSVETETESEDE